ncbi:MAG: hypothetical protein ACJ714_04375 [Ornithinibacter sp.]
MSPSAAVNGSGAAASAVRDSAPLAVAGFRQWLAGVDVGSLSDRERVDLLGELCLYLI